MARELLRLTEEHSRLKNTWASLKMRVAQLCSCIRACEYRVQEKFLLNIFHLEQYLNFLISFLDSPNSDVMTELRVTFRFWKTTLWKARHLWKTPEGSKLKYERSGIIHSGIVPYTDSKLFVVVYKAENLISLETLVENEGTEYCYNGKTIKGLTAPTIASWLKHWVCTCDI